MILDEILIKLETATLELEECINLAKESLSNTKHNIRIEDYSRAIEKQKALILELKQAYEANNDDEALRLANIIHGMTELIRDDSIRLLKELRSE